MKLKFDFKGRAPVLLSYSRTQNIGDAIQTLAMAKLLDTKVTFTDRDVISDPSLLTIVNGWLGDGWRAGDSSAIYAGVHLASRHALSRMQLLSPRHLAARDPATRRDMQRAGLASALVGCATLTLPRYHGKRDGVLAVDVPACLVPEAAKTSTHLIHAAMPWEDQAELAAAKLRAYQTAALVYTSRLHVALPCLAFGTPVVITRNPRFTVLDLVSNGQDSAPLRISDAQHANTIHTFHSFIQTAINSL